MTVEHSNTENTTALRIYYCAGHTNNSKVISIILLYSFLILTVPPESYTLYNNTPGHVR